MTKTTKRLIKGLIRVTESSIKHNANSTTSGWTYQPKAPASVEKFKKN